MLNAIKTIFAVFFCLGLTAGCGQKGPLFLPGDPSTIQTDIPAEEPPAQAGDDPDPDNEDDET